jgi:hypothetical protein
MVVNEKSDQKGRMVESLWMWKLQAAIFGMHAVRSHLLAPDETAWPLVHSQMLGKGTARCACKNLHFMLFSLLFQEGRVMLVEQFLEGNHLPDPAHNY